MRWVGYFVCKYRNAAKLLLFKPFHFLIVIQNSDRGYILPGVLAIGIAIAIMSVTVMQAIVQNSSTLNYQYYAILAREAAQAGVVSASKCIDTGIATWTSDSPLMPSTDCTGTSVAGRPNTVLAETEIKTTYVVKGLEVIPGSTAKVISSTGKVTLKSSSGLEVIVHEQNVQQVTPGTVAVDSMVAPISTTRFLLGSLASVASTCTIADSKAYCWGDNGYGQLGNNSTTNSIVPVAVSATGVLAGKTITGIGTGFLHACAVAIGQVYCWGYNSSGQLGNNSTATSRVPVAVSTAGVLAGKTVTAIGVGDTHTCAIADGRPYCWGSGGYGALGNGATATSRVPVAVSTAGVLSGKAVTGISAGWGSACVIADGKAYCWGYNNSGKHGNNSTSSTNVPVSVSTSGVLAGKTVTAISTSTGHTCAVADGKAYCWGDNGYGQLGNNSTTDSRVPVAVSTAGVLAGKTVTGISAGDYHTCAVADGKAYCWGDNSYGRIGDGTTTDSRVPVAVSTAGVLSGKTVTSISAGWSNTCAVAGGKAYCWGRNNTGQLGNGGAAAGTMVPATVVNISNISSTGEAIKVPPIYF